MQRVTVLKFGGSSLATEAGFFNAVELARGYAPCAVVVSAPGKRFSQDVKVTDLFYRLYSKKDDLRIYSNIFEAIYERFIAVCAGSEIRVKVERELDYIYRAIRLSLTADYAASRGEYLSAKIFSYYSGYTFLDATCALCAYGTDVRVRELGKPVLMRGEVVVPGFYHGSYGGHIVTFGRGGSDLTGAILATDSGADDYYNFTDVDGVMEVPPEYSDSPKLISISDYDFLYAASYYGADVVQAEAVKALRGSGVRLHVRNTFNPSVSGTTVYDGADVTDNVCVAVCAENGLRRKILNAEFGYGVPQDGRTYITPIYRANEPTVNALTALISAQTDCIFVTRPQAYAPVTYAVATAETHKAIRLILSDIPVTS